MNKFLWLVLVFLLAACQAPDEIAIATTVPTATATMEPAATAKPTDSATPISATSTLPPAATAIPTPNPTQAVEPTATATATTIAETTELPAPTATQEAAATTDVIAAVTDEPVPTVEPVATVESSATFTTPTVIDFSASHWTVGGGEPLVLNWDVANADTAVLLLIDANGGETPLVLDGLPTDSYIIDWQAGDYPLPPLQGSNNQYRLLAYNDSESTTHEIRITYDPALASGMALAINAFTITPAQITTDSTMTLQWDVAGAERIDLFKPDAGPDTGGLNLMFSTTDPTGSRTISYSLLPSYFFESYGLSSIFLTLRAFDSAGQMQEASVEVTLLRPVGITSFEAEPGVISAETPITINYGVNWAFSANIFVQHPTGDYLVHSADLIGGSPAQPESAGRSFSLTWADVTQNGSISHDGGTVTLLLQAYGGDQTAEQTLTFTTAP